MSSRDPREEADRQRKLREYEAQQRRAMQSAPKRAAPRGGGQKPPARRPVGLYLPWWGIVVVVAVIGLATCGLWAFVLSSSPDVSGDVFGGLTPTFFVITDTPTPGEPEPLEPTATPVPEFVTPTPHPEEPTPEPPSLTEQIIVGSEVAITGTEGDGLAVRQGPGVTYAYFLVAHDGEVFVVEEGPRQNDGFTWWYIVDPADEDRFGWAVESFMIKVPENSPLQEVTPTPEDESEGA